MIQYRSTCQPGKRINDVIERVIITREQGRVPLATRLNFEEEN
jgi:hypothetical protein